VQEDRSRVALNHLTIIHISMETEMLVITYGQNLRTYGNISAVKRVECLCDSIS
jgi:hypothetical protein